MTQHEKKWKKYSYTTVSIPLSLMKRIDDLIASGKYTYRNRSDFVLDALRKRLRELGYEA